MKTVTNIVIAGLGGQGIITASDILADAIFRAGFDVKKAEVHGMSQRGGSVTSDVRFGPHVLSPMVSAGEADFVLLFEASEAATAQLYLAPGGVLLRADALASTALSNPKAMNVAMLGMLSAHLPVPEESWMEALRAGLPAKLHEANYQAFRAGRSVAGKEKPQ